MLKQSIATLMSASALLVSTFVSTTASAGSESGFYIGASTGQSSVEASDKTPGGESFNFSEKGSAYKVLLGFNLGLVPFIDLAVEGAYMDFGEPDGSLSDGTKISYEMTGWSTFGLAGMTFGPFSVFGKAGAVSWDTDVKIGDSTGGDSGSDGAYGLGAKFQLGSIAIRAEYEYFDVSKVDDVKFTSVGLVYTF